MEKLFVYDLETTGTEPKSNGIHQLSGLIIIEGKIMDDFNYFIKPYQDQIINIQSLAISNTTLGRLESYTRPQDAFIMLITLMTEYCNKYDRNDRFHIVGYNNAVFDNLFLREYFLRNNSSFNNYFWDVPIDVFVLAGYYLAPIRHAMPDFKLSTVAKQLGIHVREENLHSARYDAELTYQIYKILKAKLKTEDM